MKEEYILCSAIWFDDGKKHQHQPINVEQGLVVCGMRHHNCFYTTYALNGDERYGATPHKEIQGFLTSNNRFVDREEAAKIAFKAVQIYTPVKKLFSEDLY